MDEQFSRNIMYWGENTQKILKEKHGIIFGLGGVGGYTAEALARAGIGKLSLVDFDTVSASNINRQIIALNSTLGQKKTTLFKQRLEDINPKIKIKIYDCFYCEEKNEEIFAEKPDFVVDAIDTQKSKIELLIYCKKNNIPVYSSMGAGNRLNPTELFIGDLSEAAGLKCNFVTNLYKNLQKQGVNTGITCVFSHEKPKKPTERILGIINTLNGVDKEIKKISPSSTPFVPPVAGYMLAYAIIVNLCKAIDKKK